MGSTAGTSIIEFEGIPLIGAPVMTVDAALIRHIEEHDLGLILSCGGNPGVDDRSMYVRADRAGDTVVSAARFFQEGWEDHD
ncbi:hypothetical protein [Streptomyces sp. NPDC048606]|uniref:hypothetical protein n=1 Tax=Streptomyces sp. NPDC048606 TaxID=3154726 RepID=UPI00342FD70A